MFGGVERGPWNNRLDFIILVATWIQQFLKGSLFTIAIPTDSQE